MRLICPNCAAQYEVPDQVIPEDGRDVQCSNCGHTWFQSHGAPEPDEPDMPDAADTAWDDPLDDDPEPPEPESVPERPAAPRSIDPQVAEVLREEAAREARRRAAEAGGVESQPELGLSDPDDTEVMRQQREARNRMARMRGEAQPAATEPAIAVTAVTSRRDLLPNVDEINQTLRASTDRRAVETPQGRAPYEEEDDGGFGRGFVYVVIVVVSAIAVYVFAEQIAEWVPALSDVLAGYVTWVDDLRLWLDGQVSALLSGGPEAPVEPAE